MVNAMRQQALPEGSGRCARLGRALGAAAAGEPTRAVVLLLPGGVPESTSPPSPLPLAAARPLARRFARLGTALGMTSHLVRYRYRGWNGSAAHPAVDAAWAVREAHRRYGDVPVALAGLGMGGRAALRAADHPSVASVLALSPWLPGRHAARQAEPVRQLVGRQVLLVHGTNDERTDPDLSFRLAERAKKINRDVCRFEVHSDGHGLRQHRGEVAALATDFALGSLLGHPYARPIGDALAAPPPIGLRMPLATGFGVALRY